MFQANNERAKFRVFLTPRPLIFQHFYCENGVPLFVPKAVRFDGKADCSDRSDECPKKQLEGAFASNLNMIANPFLLAMVWIMAVISTFGKFILIFLLLMYHYSVNFLHHYPLPNAVDSDYVLQLFIVVYVCIYQLFTTIYYNFYCRF